MLWLNGSAVLQSVYIGVTRGERLKSGAVLETSERN